mgnify:CR=1 FL=1
MKEGEGQLQFAEGSVYKGEFKSNEINGVGYYKWNDGKVYEGQWALNKMNG